MKLHLVDGTFELFRAFYGAPSHTTADGREVGAARSFGYSLLRLLRQKDVTHVAVAFDHVIESFRNQLFDGYKTGEGIDPVLWSQAPMVERVTEALGVPVWPMVEFEADDALAAAAERFAGEFDQVVICTPDKDLAQCISGTHVVSWDRIRDRVLDEDGVKEKFGVSPSSIPDYLALVGDSADGIPGIPRWGAKSTATVLGHYRHIEEIPDAAGDWQIKVRGAATLANNLAAARADALLYRRLATLRTDVPLPETSIDELQWRGANTDLLTRVAGSLDAPRLVDVPR